MRRFWVISALIAIGAITCGARAPASLNHNLNELKRELILAEKDLTKAQERVAQLEEEIAQQEIRRIEEQIGKIGEGEIAALLHSREQRLAFFSDQRETLSSIIQKHPVCALQAQAVLDQILTLITHISDEIID